MAVHIDTFVELEDCVFERNKYAGVSTRWEAIADVHDNCKFRKNGKDMSDVQLRKQQWLLDGSDSKGFAGGAERKAATLREKLLKAKMTIGRQKGGTGRIQTDNLLVP